MHVCAGIILLQEIHFKSIMIEKLHSSILCLFNTHHFIEQRHKKALLLRGHFCLTTGASNGPLGENSPEITMDSDFVKSSLTIKLTISRLLKTLHRAFNLIESSKIKDAFNRNILDVRELMLFDRAVMTFKIVNMLGPVGLQNKFVEKSALSNYKTRNMKNLQVQKLKLEHIKRSFLYTAPNTENSIPQSIKNAETIERFKKELKSHLLS